jgi:E3 ubiquitin-protein ligase ZNRF1/2
MGAKPSTANGSQSPSSRVFSTSSSSEVVAAPVGFRLLRAIPGIDLSADRQRARSLSSVPDLHASHETIAIPATGASFDVSTGASPESDSSSAEEAVIGAQGATSIALGRVYAAHSLPSHIWSLNGKWLRESKWTKLTVKQRLRIHKVPIARFKSLNPRKL